MARTRVGIYVSRRRVEAVVLAGGGATAGPVYRARAIGGSGSMGRPESGLVAEAVFQALEDAGVGRGADVALCVATDWTYVARVSVPRSGRGRGDDRLLLYEAESQWPVDVEALQTRVVRRPARDGRARGVVLGCPAEVVSACEERLKGSGHRVQLVTAAPLVVWRRVRESCSGEGLGRAMAFWDEGEGVAVSAIEDGGVVSFFSMRPEGSGGLSGEAVIRQAGLHGRGLGSAGEARRVFFLGPRSRAVAEAYAGEIGAEAWDAGGDGGPDGEASGGAVLALASGELLGSGSGSVAVAVGRSAHQAWVKRVRGPLAAMFGLLAVAVALTGARLLSAGSALRGEVAVRDEALLAVWRSATDEAPPPAAHVVIRLRAMHQRLQATQGKGVEAVAYRDVLRTWRDVVAAIPADVKVFLEDVQVDQQGLRMTGELATHGAAERIRTAIRGLGYLTPEAPRSQLLSGGGVGFVLSAAYGERHADEAASP